MSISRTISIHTKEFDRMITEAFVEGLYSAVSYFLHVGYDGTLKLGRPIARDIAQWDTPINLYCPRPRGGLIQDVKKADYKRIVNSKPELYHRPVHINLMQQAEEEGITIVMM